MKKIMTFEDHVEQLQNLSDQVSRLESQLNKITVRLSEIEPDQEDPLNIARQPVKPDRLDFSHITGGRSNIMLFPGLRPQTEQKQTSAPFIATPGKQLPGGIPDFRPVLQRDGLILIAWDKRKTEMGDRFTAYWVTSTGIPRFYASKPYAAKIFPTARPDHKSYAAEDGIEFYGQKAPAFMVHVAPELMMSNPQHGELRHNHIKVLKEQGITVNFDYKYLLTKDKNRKSPEKKQKIYPTEKAGA